MNEKYLQTIQKHKGWTDSKEIQAHPRDIHLANM